MSTKNRPAANKKESGKSASPLASKGKSPGKNKARWLWILPLIIFSYIIYTPALKNTITGWDDKNYIVENTDIRHFDADFLKKSFSLHTGYVMGNYHPLTMISYALEYKYSQLNPKTFHTTNVLLHLVNGALVFLFIWLLSGRSLVTIITSSLFLLHPMHVESVAWIAERKDLLYCLFELSALSAYIVYIKKEKKLFYILTFVFFLLAVLSKAMAVAMVGILPLLDYYFGRKLTNVKVILEKLPFLIAGILFGLIAIQAQKEFGSIAEELHPWSDRFLFAGYSFITYLWKAALPLHLNTYYDYPAPGTFSTYILHVILSIGILFFTMLTLRKTKKLFFGFFFFTISIVLVLQLLPVGGAILAERYTYIPYIGLFYLVGEGIYFLWERHQVSRFKTLFPLASVVLAIYFIFISTTTHARCKVWKDTISIWDDALKQNPNIIKAYNGRGNGYNDKQMYPEAIRDLTRALELKTDYADAYYNRGLSYYYVAKQYQDRGNLDEAIKYYELSVADNSAAIKFQPALARAWYNRSGNYFILKKFDLALSDALKARELGMVVDQAFLDILEKEVYKK